MNTREVQDLWAKTLESNRFKQGKSLLHNKKTDELCCLGVLCKLYEENVGPLVIGSKYLTASNRIGISYNGEIYDLPPKVMLWAGLTTKSGKYKMPKEYPPSNYLTTNNDAGLSFKSIAGIIRERPEGLFVD